MNKFVELILGLILVVVPIVLAVNYYPGWGIAAREFIQGGVVVGVVLVGVLFIMLGISDMKG